MAEQQGQAQPAPSIEDRISAILAADEKPEAKSAPADPQPEGDDYQPGENTQVEGDGEGVPEGEVQAEETAEATEQAVAEIPLDQVEAIELEVTYKAENGKDVTEKLPIKELREGYMRKQDYSRKTAEVARQRDEVGEKVRQGIESERNAYLQNLQSLQTVLMEVAAPELKNVDWNELAATNTYEYVRLRNRADQIVQAVQTIQTKQKEAAEKVKAEQGQAYKAAAQRAVQELQSGIPNWSDSLYSELIKMAPEYGYKPEEVAQWVDARAIKVLHDAYQFRQLKPGKPAAGKKVVVPPKVVKPGARVDRAVQQHAEAMKRLQKSGTVEDAAAVIAARMR